jgi:hypothetical protein
MFIRVRDGRTHETRREEPCSVCAKTLEEELRVNVGRCWLTWWPAGEGDENPACSCYVVYPLGG